MPAAAPITKGDTMNEEQLQAIEERANAATPGKWEPVHANNDVRIWRDGCIVAVFPYDMPYYTTAHNADADAVFCVNARADVPALIAEVRRLRAKLDAVPVDAMGTVMEVADIPFGYLAERNTIGAWLNEAGWKA